MSDDPDDDHDAVSAQRVLAGDLSAFEGIVARGQERLYALAFRLSRDRGRAEDMTQEAFVKVFRSLHQWRGESAFSTWMTSVALNAYRSYLRLRPWVAQSLEDDASAAGEEPAEDLRAARVRRVVAALPARYRDALTLFYFAGKDVDQVAAVLRVSSGTVKARLHRGRQLVERALNVRGGDA